MNIFSFSLIVYCIFSFWVLGLLMLFISKENIVTKKIGLISIIVGVSLIVFNIIYLWIYLNRPPIRTLGETRLWYSFFLSTIGLIIYFRWKYLWLLPLSLSFAGLFLLLDLLKPAIFDQTLMPALQSPWFIPHVIVYIIAYALLGITMLISIKGVFLLYKGKFNNDLLMMCDNIVYIAFSFLTMGLLFGALWAKNAWGSYWTWDPKETWAFITWMSYLLYIHYRNYHKTAVKIPLFILSLSFIILLLCWFGINYMAAAQNSVHVYSN